MAKEHKKSPAGRKGNKKTVKKTRSAKKTARIPAKPKGARKKTLRVPVKPKKTEGKEADRNAVYRDMLLRLRERITGQIGFLVTDNLSLSSKVEQMDFRSEEQGTDNFERDFALNRASMDQNTVFEIDEALNRLAIGTFGRCESCGKRIEKVRLQALPHSRLCIACKSQTERQGGKFQTHDSRNLFSGLNKGAPGGDGAEEDN